MRLGLGRCRFTRSSGMACLLRARALAPLHRDPVVYCSCRGLQTSSPRDGPFGKILIANRGEIAIRVMKTCKKLGIKSVAVYSEADANALFTQCADEAICIGPPPSAKSYLNADAIIDACKRTGAEAVHPGYGFLSERHQFAEALRDNNIVFIGPSPKALLAMGDKIESKRIAKAANVSIVPGFDGVVKDADEAVEIAKGIGYPVMVKAAGGGGGKGMRIAYSDQQVRDGFRLSSQEAKSSFNDDRLLVEKFIEEPRHIEFQLLADTHGNAVYLHERECSVQRRNQKVIEEAPSSYLDPSLRKAMGQQAVMLALAVGYSTAGTVEFLVDKNRNFYFLEMNTRLQVEHPVTEMVTGIDIVEQMIHIAAGKRLAFTQAEVPLKGWSFECRVYAEDPYKNFGMPSIGRLVQYREPSHVPNVRIDSGIVEGSEISIYYDSMISKIISYGETRASALETMRQALDEYVIRGVTHNIPLLRDIIDNKHYIAGNFTTKFLPTEYPDGFKGRHLSNEEECQLVSAAAVEYLNGQRKACSILNSKLDPLTFSPTEIEIVIQIKDKRHSVSICTVEDKYELLVNGNRYVYSATGQQLSYVNRATVNGNSFVYQVISRNGQLYKIQHHGTQYEVQVFTQAQAELEKIMPVKFKEDMSPFLRSPMPGTVVSVSVQPGHKVTVGQEMAVVEAMKMQNSLTIHRNGVVKAVRCKPGDRVSNDDILVELEPCSM